MFEEMTYEKILEDMLSRVTSDVDKREGSVIYDALAPCAYQLAQTYFYLMAFVDLVFGDTAVGEYLDRVVDDYGITRKAATYSVRKIETSGSVDIGTRWGRNGITYTITELLSTNVYRATCEQIGEIGNTYTGTLENIDNVSGVTATLTDVINSGEDEETDDNLRERFFSQVRSTPASGNAANYKKWALEVTGVGDAKVFPLWNGSGTVKVVIVDNDKQPANSDLLQETMLYIDEVRPIGAEVTVVSGAAKGINITAKVILADGYNLQTVNSLFLEAIKEYFKSITFLQSYISYAKIGTILLSVSGILDYSDLKINGTLANVSIANEEIPIISTAVLGV